MYINLAYSDSENKQPTVQKLTGSGTYTKPAGVLYIKVRIQASGGGLGDHGQIALVGKVADII